jgi:hypothetical protein
VIWRFLNQHWFSFCMLATPFVLYYLLVLDEERLQAYFAIRRCVRACEGIGMIQVHVAHGCGCVGASTSQLRMEAK